MPGHSVGISTLYDASRQIPSYFTQDRGIETGGSIRIKGQSRTVAEIHFFRWGGGAKPPKFPTKL